MLRFKLWAPADRIGLVDVGSWRTFGRTLRKLNADHRRARDREVVEAILLHLHADRCRTVVDATHQIGFDRLLTHPGNNWPSEGVDVRS